MRKYVLSCLLILTINCQYLVSTAQILDVKIMSFNIQQPFGSSWETRRDSAVAIIKNEDPDIIGTQEAVDYQRNYLISNTKGYSWFGKGRDGADKGEGAWVFYKSNKFEIDSSHSGTYWLSNTPLVPSRLAGSYNRIYTYARLIDKESKKAFYIFNIHNYMPSESDLRLKAAKMFVKKIHEIANNQPFIITGDFNSSENDALTYWMKSGVDNLFQFRDSYRELYPTGWVTTGFGTKFDYIYFDKQPIYKAKSSWVVNAPSNASDHMPIVAIIAINLGVEFGERSIAEAGIDSIVKLPIGQIETTIQLDASKSFIPKANGIKLSWFDNGKPVSSETKAIAKLSIGSHIIGLSISDSVGFVSRDFFTVNVVQPTNTSYLLGSAPHLYTNIVTDMLRVVHRANEITSINVFNTSGIKVAGSLYSNQLEISRLKVGCYFVIVKIKKESWVYKISKI